MKSKVLSLSVDNESVVKKIRLSRKAWIDYYPHFLDSNYAQSLMQTLIHEEAWEQRKIMALQKEVIQPRLMSWGGDIPYHYSGQTLPVREIHPSIIQLWSYVEQMTQHTFNHVVINYYRDGKDHMGMHADDEKQLGFNPVIAAISLGINRRFHVAAKHRKARKRIYKLMMHHGSLMVMQGDMQHRWRHGVPKMKETQPQGERINITFRYLHAPPTIKET